ncbi:MAG TPA: nodulation protein NfeD [Candidatus Limnocylindrales bacterium]|nr:nodulation protein NfeD [Candidatus Limnocylindrales bacterium]
MPPVVHSAARIAARVALVAGLVGMLTAGARAAEPQVVLLPTTGIVDQVMAAYLRDGIASAAAGGADAVIIKLNTPGGSLTATNDIVGSVYEAPLPVIVWVAPAGGFAASAGTFITLAGHVALMAPGTSIGAASPVGGGGEDIPGRLGDKVLNDAVAKITSIAKGRGRNVEWAIETVKEARSSAAEEAVSLHAVDGLAATIDEVLAAAEGRTVSVTGKGDVTLALAGASVSTVEMNPLQGFLHLLSDPNISFILFTVGFYGLIFELSNPNFVTGIAGAFAIILAFIGFGSLPLNVGGLLLIGLAIVLFVLEFTVTSHGLLTVGGLAAFVLGASALFGVPNTPTAPAVTVDVRVIAIIAAATAAYMAFILYVVVRSRREAALLGPKGTGAILPIGSIGQVRGDLRPLGVVYAAGEEWSARTGDSRAVPRGSKVRVVAQEGLTLIVEPLESAM